MRQTGFPLRTNTQRYALFGAAFGLLFPIFATILYVLDAGMALSLSSIIAAQATEPLLWIIDTAPIFLGIFAAIAGSRLDELENINSVLRSREQELESAQLILEERVSERTRDLTSRNQMIQDRADQLNTVVETSRSLLSTYELDQLLPLIVQSISQQYHYYHVGLYLLDERKQHPILKASSSEGGTRIMQRGQSLNPGGGNLVALAIQSGRLQILNGIGTDSKFPPDPDLPNTRTELVLPLILDQIVIGALDLHSDIDFALNEEYLSILEILADLVAIAIQNSSLYEKTQRTLREAEINAREVSAKAWGGWVESVRTRGYSYDGIRTEPLREAESPPSTQNGIQTIPIRLRGTTIGALRIKISEASPEWTQDDQAIAEATAERAALALEGARLLEEAKSRAAREAFLADMAAKLSTSFRLDAILRDTVEELGQTLVGSTVSFQLVDPASLQRKGPGKTEVPPVIWNESE